MRFIQEKTAGLVKLRTLILLSILAAPIVVYGLAGTVAVWQVGWMRWLWWVAPIFWAIAFLVIKLWPAVIEEQGAVQPLHWTPRDQEAADIVRRFQMDADSYTTEQLTDPQFYLSQAQLIANDLARHYRPNTADPIADRTLPEILAACRLVADDLEELLLTSLPGSRLLTVNQWRKLSDAPRLVRQATKAFWATKILMNPFNVAQWGTSKVTNEKVTTNLQSELLATLYFRFVRQLGYYLIEMNSGRLRAGADAYRSAFGQLRNRGSVRQKANSINANEVLGSVTPDSTKPETSSDRILTNGSDKSSDAKGISERLQIKIAVLGQRGSGKTTLVQSLIENEEADKKKKSGRRFKLFSFPKSTRSHELEKREDGTMVILLDTPGYDPQGSGKKLNKHIQYAVENAHVILMTLDSRVETWIADIEMLQRIRDSFRLTESLKPPKVIGVITFGKSEKLIGTAAAPSSIETGGEMDAVQLPDAEDPREISFTVDRAKGQFGDLIDEYVPLLFDPVDLQNDQGLVFKMRLLEVLKHHHESARSNAALAAYEKSLNRGKYKILFRQAKASGKQFFSNWRRRE